MIERHADFFRDFRGDTIHPSTLQLMHELGLLDEFLTRPHQEIRKFRAQIGDTTLSIADMSHVPTFSKFLVLMPQWDFLNFIAEHARRYPSFRLAVIQRIQVAVQNGFLGGVLRAGANAKMKPPLALRIFAAIPLLRRIPGYVIGVGVRPEHICTPEHAADAGVRQAATEGG